MQMIIDKAEDCSMKGRFVKQKIRQFIQPPETEKEIKEFLEIDWVEL